MRQRRRHLSYRQGCKSCSPTTWENAAGQKHQPHDPPLASDFLLTVYFPCCSFPKHKPHLPSKYSQQKGQRGETFLSTRGRISFCLSSWWCPSRAAPWQPVTLHRWKTRASHAKVFQHNSTLRSTNLDSTLILELFSKRNLTTETCREKT